MSALPRMPFLLVPSGRGSRFFRRLELVERRWSSPVPETRRRTGSPYLAQDWVSFPEDPLAGLTGGQAPFTTRAGASGSNSFQRSPETNPQGLDTAARRSSSSTAGHAADLEAVLAGRPTDRAGLLFAIAPSSSHRLQCHLEIRRPIAGIPVPPLSPTAAMEAQAVLAAIVDPVMNWKGRGELPTPLSVSEGEFASLTDVHLTLTLGMAGSTSHRG